METAWNAEEEIKGWKIYLDILGWNTFMTPKTNHKLSSLIWKSAPKSRVHGWYTKLVDIDSIENHRKKF